MPPIHNDARFQTASTVSPQQLIEAFGQLHASVTDSIPGSIYIYDLVNQRTLCSSRSLAAMLGYTADEIYAMGPTGFAHLIHPDDLEQVAEHYQRFTTLLPGKVIAIEYRMTHADGAWRRLRSQETLLIQSSGIPVQILGIVQDITEFKHETDLLEILSHLVEHLPNLVLITDRQGTITYVNQAFEQVSGYSAAEVIGKSPALLKSGWHDIAFYRQLWNTLHAGKAFQAEFVNCKKNGDLFYTATTIKPIKDKQGRITHFVSVGRDVTAQRQAPETFTGFMLNPIH